MDMLFAVGVTVFKTDGEISMKEKDRKCPCKKIVQILCFHFASLSKKEGNIFLINRR